MDLFPRRPKPRLTPRFCAGAAVALVLANALALYVPNLIRWLGGPTRTVSIPIVDSDEPRPVTISAAPTPPPRSARPSPLHQAVVLLAVNCLVVSALAFGVFARYLEELRRYRLVLPTGFDERRLKPRHRRAPGLDLSATQGSRFRRLDSTLDHDHLDGES